jgi:hypothetical protein
MSCMMLWVAADRAAYWTPALSGKALELCTGSFVGICLALLIFAQPRVPVCSCSHAPQVAAGACGWALPSRNPVGGGAEQPFGSR